MGKVLLSICISSYNRAAMCAGLIQNILEIKDARYNIFICDDSSDEETVRKLRLIQGNKVTLIENEENIGPCKNWYRTIACGDGKYILHVLDRDSINISVIKTLLDILEVHSVGAGYIGKSAMSIDSKIMGRDKYLILEKGRDAFLAMAGVPIHPTGFLVNKEQWERGAYRKFFYEDRKYGIYPHSYVLGRVAVQRDMLYMPISFCSHIYRGENRKSAFYQKMKDKDYWWLPESTMKTANRSMLYLYQFADDSYKDDFVCKRFREGLYRATIGYKMTASDTSEMQRYGLSVDYISKWILILYSLEYKLVFAHVLNKLEVRGWSIRKKIMKIWLINMRDIITDSPRRESHEKSINLGDR